MHVTGHTYHTRPHWCCMIFFKACGQRMSSPPWGVVDLYSKVAVWWHSALPPLCPLTLSHWPQHYALIWISGCKPESWGGLDFFKLHPLVIYRIWIQVLKWSAFWAAVCQAYCQSKWGYLARQSEGCLQTSGGGRGGQPFIWQQWPCED